MILGVHGKMVALRVLRKALGSAHHTGMPSRSNRKSQCSRRAWCSWITNVLSLPGSSGPAAVTGSGVRAAERLRRYGATCQPYVVCTAPHRGKPRYPPPKPNHYVLDICTALIRAEAFLTDERLRVALLTTEEIPSAAARACMCVT